MNDSAEFSHQSVRDLAWAIYSPPLISQLSCACLWPNNQWFQEIYQQTLPWLNVVDSDPAELDELLAGQKDRRLGKYFESLWYFWLSHNPRYQILENNIQIIIEGETLGEIDFIVFDKLTGQTQHWEVAVKFYLGTDDTSAMNNWHGPNLRDRLDIKVSHLLERQSVISKQPRVAQWLKQRGIEIDACVVVLKGRLYYPWRESVSWQDLLQQSSPLQCDSAHLRSWWLNTDIFEQLFDDEQHFMPLINRGWLERFSTQSVKNLYSKNEIFETISNNVMRLPLHLMLCNLEHTGDRVFLTGQSWPQKKL